MSATGHAELYDPYSIAYPATTKLQFPCSFTAGVK